ncbi:MAG: hypothetical protein GXP62_15070, partial [Oligoflexia bacterium]|nr:hypothetical protein [Oligoflexia bacterium]
MESVENGRFDHGDRNGQNESFHVGAYGPWLPAAIRLGQPTSPSRGSPRVEGISSGPELKDERGLLSPVPSFTHLKPAIAGAATTGEVRVEQTTLQKVRFRNQRARQPIPWEGEGPVLAIVSGDGTNEHCFRVHILISGPILPWGVVETEVVLWERGERLC